MYVLDVGYIDGLGDVCSRCVRLVALTCTQTHI